MQYFSYLSRLARAARIQSTRQSDDKCLASGPSTVAAPVKVNGLKVLHPGFSEIAFCYKALTKVKVKDPGTKIKDPCALNNAKNYVAIPLDLRSLTLRLRSKP